MSRLSRVFALVALALLWVVPGIASAQEWESLGRQKASPGIDRDVIRLNNNEGPYTALKFRVSGNSVTIFNARVVFGDGSAQDLPVNNLTIRPGEETVPLDLAGRRRNISRVELLYGGNLTALIKRPEIEVFALKLVERELPPLGRDWLLLGQGTVDSARDRDVIRIGAQEGQFNGLVLRVRGGDVNLRELRVIYADGEGDLYRVRAQLPSGSETEVIDLRGDERAIRQVELIYDAGRRGRGRATVEVWGRIAPERELPPLPREWTLLGQQRVDMARDRDVIRIGRDDGRYNAIIVRVKRDAVNLRQLRIVYGNGETEDLSFNRPIRAGEETRPIDLKGRFRFIDRLELTYERERGSVRAPQVEIWARQAPEVELPPLPREWQLAGQESVDPSADSTVIAFGREAGRINALVLRARRNDVRLRGFTVIYGNGEEEQFALDGPLYAGEESQVIELKGRPRFIDRIEFRLRPIARGDRPAVLEAWGRQAPEPELPPLSREWQSLAKQEVTGDGDRLAIEIGREGGRFNAILLRARRNDVRVRGMTIVYGNGDAEEVAFDEPVSAGEEASIVELKGRARYIERIELRLRPGRGGRTAQLEVWGRAAPEPELAPLSRDWQLVGQQPVELDADLVAFEAGPDLGRANALVLRVRRDDLRIRSLRIVYRNGEEDVAELDGIVYAGEDSAIVELKGRPRRIERVEVRTRVFGRAGRRAQLELWARQAPEPVPPPLPKEWQLLGKQELDPARDRAQIATGLEFGRYNAVLVRVRRDDLRMRGLTLLYGDGETDEVEFQDALFAGEEGQIFEIKGRPRFIEGVDLRYRAGVRGTRRPEVEVWVRQAPERELPPLARDWQLLGKQAVDLGRERQIIDLGDEGGRINALVLRARRDDVRLRRLRLVYANGEEEEVPVDSVLYAGEETSMLELKGRARALRSIEIVTRALGRTGRRAEIEVWGRIAPEPAPPPLPKEWQLIGKQSLDPGNDTESIEIGAEDRRYDGLLVRVRRSDLRITGMQIVYGNGDRDEVDIKETIFAGEDSPIIEIKGRPRFIDRIEIAYAAGGRRARPSEVEIWGRGARDVELPRLDASWVLLDKNRVDLGRDRDVFEIDAVGGRIDQLLLRVRGNDIDLRRAKLIYQTGDVEEIEIGQRVYSGEQTEPVPLKGRARFLQAVELTYRAVDRAGRPAEVELWGHTAKDEPFGGGWRRVDALPVDRRADKVVYELTRRDGRVKAVGIRANGGAIRLTGIAMMYGNGDKDARPLDDRLRPDMTTRAIEVTGFRRAFERIEVFYERGASIDSRTQLELWVKD